MNDTTTKAREREEENENRKIIDGSSGNRKFERPVQNEDSSSKCYPEREKVWKIWIYDERIPIFKRFKNSNISRCIR